MPVMSRMFKDLTFAIRTRKLEFADGPDRQETTLVCRHNEHQLVYSAMHPDTADAAAIAIRDGKVHLRAELERLLKEALIESGIVINPALKGGALRRRQE